MVTSIQAYLVCWLSLEISIIRQVSSTTLELGLLFPFSGYRPIGRYSAGAALLAIDALNSDEWGLTAQGVNFNYTWRDTECRVGKGLTSIFELWSDESRVDVFVGKKL